MRVSLVVTFETDAYEIGGGISASPGEWNYVMYFTSFL